MATETPGIHIRPAHPSDAAALTDVAHQAKRFWGYPEEFLALWRDALTVTPTLLVRSDTFVAVDGTRILGFISVERIDDTTFELLHLWVRPESMQRHVGRTLWHHAERHCLDRGARRIEVDSDPHAEGFYHRMGAQRIGFTPSVPEGRTLPRLRWQSPAQSSADQL
jgi:ribosomal protein S18 acetylase RimI-like enzyme